METKIYLRLLSYLTENVLIDYSVNLNLIDFSSAFNTIDYISLLSQYRSIGFT